jgi:predicted nucleic acid-binding protein
LTEAVYVDTSALVKLIAAEAESRELIEYLGVRATRIASAIVVVELGRALGRRPDVDASRSFLVLDRLVLVDTDRRILERAAGLAPAELRSLDAIHLATALEVRDSIDAVVTYDDRLAAAAQIHGFATAAPGRAG